MPVYDASAADWFRRLDDVRNRQRAELVAKGLLREGRPLDGMEHERAIDELFGFLDLPGDRARVSPGFERASASAFRGVMPASLGGSAYLWFDAKLSDLDRPLNATWLVDKQRKDERFEIFRLVERSAPDVRGRYRHMRRRFFDRTSLVIHDDGSHSSQTVLVGTDDVDVPIVRARVTIEDMRFNPNQQWGEFDSDRRLAWVAVSFAAVDRYVWTADVGVLGGSSIRFETDATGAIDLFRLRDRPVDGKRREPLLHWVRDHWRKTRTDPGLEGHVRRHLRGKTQFTWNGYVCSIRPSRADASLAQRPELADEAR